MMVHAMNSRNVPGRYYVDKKCIYCMLCHSIAPEIFQADHHNGYDYIVRQPESSLELSLVREAMLLCPSNAIHDKDQE